MHYSKKAIDRYAVGQYVEIQLMDDTAYRRYGWLVPNDHKTFHTDPRASYILLQNNGELTHVVVRAISKIMLSNMWEVPRKVPEEVNL